MPKNIAITIPAKIKWEEYEKELEAVKDGKGAIRFKVPFLPKEEIERCYLIHQGHIRGWMKTVGFFEGDFNCDTTGKSWSGKFIERSGPFHYLEEPIPMKGFQGFRYVNLEK